MLTSMKYLPISKINTVVYCQRRYFIEMLLADTYTNYHMIEGDALHSRSTRPGENIWVWHDELAIQGIIDQLKVENNEVIISEIKKGYQANHLSDQVQLCAQAICYEEMHSEQLSYGYIYYHKTRRKQKVEFTPKLRQKVRSAINTMRKLEKQNYLPPIVENTNKCRGCSVVDACQPTLIRSSWRPKDI